MALVYVLLVVNAIMEGLASMLFLGLLPPLDDTMKKFDAGGKSCAAGNPDCHAYVEFLSGICAAATLCIAVGSIAAFIGPRRCKFVTMQIRGQFKLTFMGPVPKSILILFATYHIVVAYLIAAYVPDVTKVHGGMGILFVACALLVPTGDEPSTAQSKKAQ